MENKIKIRNILISVLFTITIAALAAIFTEVQSDWYKNLELPAFQPPGIVFSVVWAALYILFAVSTALYTSNNGYKKSVALLYILNGILNPLWTYVFFNRHNIFGALFLLIVMLYAAISLYKKVYEKNSTAAYLLLPYILWLAFALYLNYETAFLN